MSDFDNGEIVLHPQFKILKKGQFDGGTPYVAVRFSDSEEFQELKDQLINFGDKLIIAPSKQKVVNGKLVSKFSAKIMCDKKNTDKPTVYDLGEFDSLDELFCTVNMAQNKTSRFTNIHPEILKEHENRFALATYLTQSLDLGLTIEYNQSKFGMPSPCYAAYYVGLKSPSKAHDVIRLADPEQMHYITTLSIEGANDITLLMQNAFTNALIVNDLFHLGNALVKINRHQIESRLLRCVPNTGLISVIPSLRWNKIFSFHNGEIIAEPYSEEKELEYAESVKVGSPLFQIDEQIYDPNDEKQYGALQKLISLQNTNQIGRQPE